jgi:DNA repair and recombination protein RAD54 and RAD54-like protein
MVDFTNPGILGDAANFRCVHWGRLCDCARTLLAVPTPAFASPTTTHCHPRRRSRKFEGPILTGREPWATEAQKAKADEAAGELSTVVNQFILRRTNTLLSQHLPPKTLAVVCCKLTPLQQALYEHFLQSQALSAIMSGRSSGVLSSITALRKLVNHPRLIYDVVRAQQAASAGGGGGRRDEGAAGFEDCEKFFPDSFHRERSACADMSGKFAVAANMLSLLRKTCVLPYRGRRA